MLSWLLSATPGLSPTRLLCPWDSSGKNTGVGCHFLPQRIFPTQGSNPSLLNLLHWQLDSLPLRHLEVQYHNEHSRFSCVSLRPHGHPVKLLCPWDSPGKNTGVGCHALLQGIFPTQGLKPGLLRFLHWQAGSLSLTPPGI